jgi:peptide/nickel transport system substrate-binding protein
MASYRKKALAVLAAASMSVALAACGSSDSDSDNPTDEGSSGGTLNYWVFSPYDHTDPQRTYLGVELTNWKRTVYRSLVNFPISTDPEVANTPVADLATDTGQSSDNAKTWKFTLKDGIKWQDGKPITCEDFKYGASRVFATDVINGGPNYILSYLDIPTDPKTGAPAYNGPYKGEGQKYFDQAITCDGNTITYHFKKPWPDFPLAVAALGMMDPYRKDMDKGNKSNYQIFSNGPYMLEGGTEWSKAKGSTFVRNPNYDPSTDSEDLRQALPDKIAFNVGQTSETIYDRLIQDSGDAQTAITHQYVPPAYYSQITGAVEERAVNVESPYVDYLVPNFERMTNPKVRRALALGTNRQAWVDAGGGTKAATVADSIVNPNVTGYQPNPSFEDLPAEGDPEAAKKLLQEAGVQMPYPITFTYPRSDTRDKQAAALKESWDKAGFDVTLDGLGDVYYSVIQKPTKKSDVMWGGWGADWPSAITVTPPLFDSRPNIQPGTVGQDYGAYKSDEFNAMVDKAQGTADLDEQTKFLQQADAILGEDTAYIPLLVTKFYFLHGSKVTGYTTTPASSQYPDLGPIGVEN